MPESSLIEGLKFMVVGMGVVFCFLWLMVGAMSAASVFFRKYEHLFPEPVAAAAPKAAQSDDVGVAIAVAAVRALKG